MTPSIISFLITSLTSRPSFIANSLTDKDSPTLICVGLTGSCLTTAGAGPAERLPAAPGRDCCPCIGGLLKPGRFPPGVGFPPPWRRSFFWPGPGLAAAAPCGALPPGIGLPPTAGRDCPGAAGRLKAGRCWSAPPAAFPAEALLAGPPLCAGRFSNERGTKAGAGCRITLFGLNGGAALNG